MTDGTDDKGERPDEQEPEKPGQAMAENFRAIRQMIANLDQPGPQGSPPASSGGLARDVQAGPSDVGELDALAGRGGKCWQPIETAPQDGTLVLLAIAGTSVQVTARYCPNGAWSKWHLGSTCRGGGVLHTEDGPEDILDPTHWMPLPEPPA